MMLRGSASNTAGNSAQAQQTTEQPAVMEAGTLEVRLELVGFWSRAGQLQIRQLPEAGLRLATVGLAIGRTHQATQCKTIYIMHH